MNDIFTAEDGQSRCSWCAATAQYRAYHDEEWGYPVADDQRLFEKLCLEGFQSGLSWRTILEKRDNFRAAFANFDFHKIATFADKDIARLLADAGIVRHRGKIEATINNAKCAQAMLEKTGSLAAFFWRYEPEAVNLAPSHNLSQSAESVALSKALKKQGWKFVGPTTAYAFMQSMGMVNDHAHECHTRQIVEQARAVFKRPQ